MPRKTSKEYSKEYKQLLINKKAIETCIKKRTMDMCKKFPDVMITPITSAKEFIDGDNVYIQTYIKVMSKIEEHNEQQSGHVQTTLYPKS